VSFQGRLLAVGGKTESWESTPAVYVYNSTTDSWDIISHMTAGRFRCFTAVLPDNRLMVVGGPTMSVELATAYDN
jgi:N-acetylneuraminic acid mutarotase